MVFQGAEKVYKYLILVHTFYKDQPITYYKIATTHAWYTKKYISEGYHLHTVHKLKQKIYHFKELWRFRIYMNNTVTKIVNDHIHA